jgi:large subunit ribosomal protein L31
MKKDIHPKYFSKAKVKCACGKEYVLGSTEENMSIDICFSCHPFYTGADKVIDTAGRLEKFKTRAAASSRGEVLSKKAKKAVKKEKKSKSETA